MHLTIAMITSESTDISDVQAIQLESSTLIIMPISPLDEERGRLIWAGHEQLNVITDIDSIECTEPAQTGNTGFWSRPFLPGEDTSQPLSSSLEVFLVFICRTESRSKG